jgi:hypothetical protein
MTTRLEFGEWEEVRIVKPYSLDRWFLGRLPQVGESGTIVHINDERGPQATYVVECNEPNAQLIWLAEFTAQEIERL